MHCILYIDPIRDLLISIDPRSRFLSLLCFRIIRARAHLIIRIHLLPTRRLNRKTTGAPTTRNKLAPFSYSTFELRQKTNLRNNLTIGLHFTTPGARIPSSGGLHEYCTSSISSHLCKSTGSPLRRFSLKPRWMIWTREGRSSVAKIGTRGAIFRTLRGWYAYNLIRYRVANGIVKQSMWDV